MAHHYYLGASRTGKSTLLKNRIHDSIKANHAVCFIDPHGPDTDHLMKHIPEKYIPKTIHVDLTDPDYYLSWNLLEISDNIDLTASILTDTIKDTAGFHGLPTARMEMFLLATLTTLLIQKKPIADVLDLLDDPKKLEKYDFKNPVLTNFWKKYNKKSERDRDASNESTYNKFFRLLIDTRIHRVLSVSQGHFKLKDAVKDKILLIRLPKGQLGEGKSSLMGSVFLSLIHIASMQRDTTVPFDLYIDEVHNFSNTIIEEMLASLGKFNVNIHVAHQSVKQISESFFDSLMGNCEYKHVFRVSPDDAIRFQKPFGYHGDINLFDLEKYQYRTFPWHNGDLDNFTEPPKGEGRITRIKKIKNYTRNYYCERIKNED